mgnify:FL=1
MYRHIEACKENNQSQRAYCLQHGIAYSTFQYWAKKYREEFATNRVADKPTGFIPVRVQPAPDVSAQAPGTSQLHFLYPNGIQVVCPEGVHPEVLKNLINP